MQDPHLRYQPVIASDSTISLHEVIVDHDGELISVSFEPIKLQATSMGELSHILRQAYHHLQKTKPISEDELDEMLFSRLPTIDEEIEQESNVIDLVDYFSGVR